MALPIASAPACGCGAMIPSDRGGSTDPNPRVDEWSIVRFDGREEVIAMRLESTRAFDRAALIMPVPARARFALGDEAQFAEMTRRTEPRVVRRTDHVLFGGDDDDEETGGGGGETATAGAGGVEVVGAQDLGPLRVVTLRGDDAGIVGTWLSDHGFEPPDGLEPIAQEYLDRGWLLVAARLRGADGPVQRVQPLIVRFPSREVVYPLRMSELAQGPTEARVDVVAPQPLAVEGRGWPRRDLEEPGDRGSGRIFGGPLPDGRYLTSYRFAIASGGFEDPRFVAAERDDFRQTIYEIEKVDITGRVFAIAGGALALIAVLVVLFARRRLAG
ncbi:MAG TPA: DUF2330 domain-containing protein [Solirubrobacteraceae bacterium]|nr:DUF2330 domain-containing protein [Solirubrobacteraceae bacterium]